MLARLLGLLLLTMIASPALAGPSLCSGAADMMANDEALAGAVALAYPDAVENDHADCVLPVAFMDRGSSPVLLTQAKGEFCHACSADLSAVVFSRSGGKLVEAGRSARFLQAGGWGRAPEAKKARIGGSDVIVFESVYSNGGSSENVIFPVLVKRDRVIVLAKDGLRLSYEDSGTEHPNTDIDGKWAGLPDGRLVLTYLGKAKGKRIHQSLTFQIKGDKLNKVSGNTPAILLR